MVRDLLEQVQVTIVMVVLVDHILMVVVHGHITFVLVLLEDIQQGMVLMLKKANQELLMHQDVLVLTGDQVEEELKVIVEIQIMVTVVLVDVLTSTNSRRYYD